MTKNLIPKVCKLLGVEVGEEFKINVDGDESPIEYYIEQRGMLCEAPFYKRHIPAYGLELADLLSGYAEIVKMPWKPKEKEQYWSFITKYKDNHNVIWNVGDFIFRGNCYDCAALKAGWVYRTKEEAEAALPKVAEELGVKYEI